MSVKNVIISADFIVSFIVSLGFVVLMPNEISNVFSLSIYSIGISVLSIVFSVFFAALAVIITSPEDAFVEFLEEKGHYTRIINSFKYTLLLLFVALVYSIVVYFYTSYMISIDSKYQCDIIVGLFIFLFSYSLYATFEATNDAINFSKYRTGYNNLKSKKNESDD